MTNLERNMRRWRRWSNRNEPSHRRIWHCSIVEETPCATADPKELERPPLIPKTVNHVLVWSEVLVIWDTAKTDLLPVRSDNRDRILPRTVECYHCIQAGFFHMRAKFEHCASYHPRDFSSVPSRSKEASEWKEEPGRPSPVREEIWHWICASRASRQKGHCWRDRALRIANIKR